MCEMCAKCLGVCHSVLAGVKGEDIAHRMDRPVCADGVMGFKTHVSCVGMLE